MKEVRWDHLKNEQLKRDRGISFEEVLQGELIQDRVHPTRLHQKLMLFDLDGYVWVIPYIESEHEIFLKIVYPSRKHTRLYLKGRITRESGLEKD